MASSRRIFGTWLGVVVILGVVGLMAIWASSRLAGRNAEILKVENVPLPDISSPAFSLVDQDGRSFSSDSLKGKVWIADFIFTSCPGPCPLLTQKMSQLQKQLMDGRIEFVSFSIDPETDTPPVLKAYAEKFSALPRWHFLTGGDNATFSIARGLKLPAVPASGDNPIFHTTKFTLINPNGLVAGYYDYDDVVAMTKLVADAQKLADSIHS